MHQNLARLLEGNAGHASQFQARFDDVQDAQRPDAVTVCCSDSRVLQDHMWANDTPGRLFTCSNIGNRVIQRADGDEFVSGDVLYPITHTGTKLAIIVGHTGCGAITAAYDELTNGGSEPKGITYCLDLLTPRLAAGVELLPSDLDRSAAVNRLVEYNVDQQVEWLEASDDIPGDVTVVGVVYDFQDVYSERRGAVHVINIGGESAVGRLRDRNPEIAPRVARLWEY